MSHVVVYVLKELRVFMVDDLEPGVLVPGTPVSLRTSAGHTREQLAGSNENLITEEQQISTGAVSRRLPMCTFLNDC